MSANPQPMDIGILMALAYQSFVRELRAALAEQGFDDQGRSDGFVLRELGARPLRIADLAVRLEITKQGAAQIVEDMERRGYVRRRADLRDKRAQLLELTERGESALAAARRFHQRYERRLVRAHGREAVATMRALLATTAGGPEETLDPQLRALYG